MKTYKTLTPVTLTGGRYRLTPDQRRRRARLVQPIDEHTVEALAELTFKAGELVTTDLDIPKALAQTLEEQEPPKKAKKTPSAEG
jgi:hypothetical protein